MTGYFFAEVDLEHDAPEIPISELVEALHEDDVDGEDLKHLEWAVREIVTEIISDSLVVYLKNLDPTIEKIAEMLKRKSA